MASQVQVQAMISSEVAQRASAVLARDGMTVEQAIDRLLTKVADDGALPLGMEEKDPGYDEWFLAQVDEALNDESDLIPHSEVKEIFRKKREEMARRILKEYAT